MGDTHLTADEVAAHRSMRHPTATGLRHPFVHLHHSFITPRARPHQAARRAAEGPET
jgi:hypothetical protein